MAAMRIASLRSVVMGFGRVERAAMTVIQMEAMVVIQTVNLSVATHSSILMRSVTMVTGAQGMAVALAVRLSDVEMGSSKRLKAAMMET